MLLLSGLGSSVAGAPARLAQQQQRPTPAAPQPHHHRQQPAPRLQQQQQHSPCSLLVVCRAAAAAEDAAAAAAAAERRRLRQERSAARQQTGDSSSSSDGDEDEDDDADADAVTTEQASSSSSRLAARRQQRAQLRGGARRRGVPAALAPADVGIVSPDDDDDKEEEEEEDGTAAAVAAEGDEDWDFTHDRAGSASLASEEEADAGGADAGSEPRQQLPESVLQQTAGFMRLQKQQKLAAEAAAADGSSGGGGQRQQQQQQQRRAAAEPLELQESSPMYLPVLTDEDLAADPPGHKSGYAAVIGRPNAGKSTLINAIVGQKLSIVTFKPQTTRHRVVGIASEPAYQLILFDTPGIMEEQRSKLDERMMAAVVSSIKAAEVILAVVDAGDDPQQALAMFQPGPDWSGPPMAVLLNKADLLSEEQLGELRDWYTLNCRAEQVFVGSALSGDDPGVAAIKAWAVEKLPEGPTLYPKSMVSQQPERFFVSEIIREQIFLRYDQEIPYACQVQITDFKERRGAKDYIEAVILVERESQAPIVLGRGGAAIKALGSAARAQIEEFLGRKVFLQLSVQVAPAWRQQTDRLKQFGYFDSLYVS